ncbi:fragile X messenger ribonucleoprotein 1-like isoform X1 [Takifugu flavidus]|uniref:Fragile X mental retardation syndrome-related protein 1 n=2 Tax=Takifugu flavidus TaxID=433684 RepID=A0A5C6MIL6_9TELE|nr:fragile X messenger ribonucleoprotein 1-like isoform X1 [Takifugu flavidus]XP_056901679.1 fragile X messenger ribonucleoprotein 1-like isoform X1 [Takifugu flavidus]TWW53170.1 Fragile X mental retardation syndrome-related protein 1 [Takifugu flavidus]TWW80185.1 Fragile X mental retardation syndrome-related protein 1 [Takifugu flavidus]
MVQVNVEVEGMNGAFYEAQIKSIAGKLLTVVYENSPQEEVVVCCDSVRRLPPPNFSCNVAVGDEVEVFSRLGDQEPFGWWLAQIKMIIGEWYLIEYMDGFQEFVKSGSIRNKNTDTFCTVEMLMQLFCLEEPRVRLQEEQCHAQAETKDQGCQTQADDGGQPTEYAGSSEQRAHTTGNGSLRDQKCLSSEAHSGQPADSGEHTEELWQTDEDQPVWTLKLEPKPPKVKKPARRRNCQRRLREYTMDDEYDDEEIRITPQGLCLFRLFGSRWVAMA